MGGCEVVVMIVVCILLMTGTWGLADLLGLGCLGAIVLWVVMWIVLILIKTIVEYVLN